MLQRSSCQEALALRPCPPNNLAVPLHSSSRVELHQCSRISSLEGLHNLDDLYRGVREGIDLQIKLPTLVDDSDVASHHEDNRVLAPAPEPVEQ